MCDVKILDDAIVRSLGDRALVESSFQDLWGVDGEGVSLWFQQDHLWRAEKRVEGIEGWESPQQDDRVHPQGIELEETALEIWGVRPGFYTAHWNKQRDTQKQSQRLNKHRKKNISTIIQVDFKEFTAMLEVLWCCSHSGAWAKG